LAQSDAEVGIWNSLKVMNAFGRVFVASEGFLFARKFFSKERIE